MSIQVSTRIDEVTKQQFDKVCERIGTSPSNAISMFIKGVINYNGIPFNAVALPESIPKALRESMLGCMKGKIQEAKDHDWFEPMEDFKEYME
ncbi:MAG: type II toxin-antitoxin system RelB/DinJ family antitoxin [Clostridiales bacterium]|nr:type II toxin-antitoxin system RelB/DinJ family antitoxin [Clostridiales bacterium]